MADSKAAPRHNRWTGGPESAAARLSGGPTVPGRKPGFSLNPQSTVFAIGSGFARHIEDALGSRGVAVTSLGRDDDIMEVRLNPQLGLLNKYNPPSIQQEIEWAIGHREFNPEGLIAVGDKWSDPYLCQQSPTGTQEAILARRNALRAYFARALKADLVIVTLDLTETWFDRTTRLALTEAPAPGIIKAEPKRFGLKRLSCKAAEDCVRSICMLLRQHNPDTKIVLTVSPVPMEQTYTTDDIIVANQISKGTLQLAATRTAFITPNVDYFPCYEAAIASDPTHVWEADRRTVRPEMLGTIMDAFTDRYGLAVPQDFQKHS